MRKPGKKPKSGTRPGLATFNRIGVLVFIGLLGLGGWYEQTALVGLAGLVLLTIGLTRGLSRVSLARVELERSLSPARIFPGEEVESSIRLANRKPLPLTWLTLGEEIPGLIGPAGIAMSRTVRPGSGKLKAALSLLWYRRAELTRRLSGRARGVYTLGPVELTSGDPFGLFPRTEIRSEPLTLTVLPRLYGLGRFGLDSRHPLGEAVARRRIFEDPNRTIGLRPYTPEAPFKHIHWKATARHQALQVKVFEPTTSLRAVLILDLAGFPPQVLGRPEEPLEVATGLAGSLAKHLIEAGHPVGLALRRDGTEPVLISPGSGNEHLIRILESLARAVPDGSAASGSLPDALQGRLPLGATLVFITRELKPVTAARLEELARFGFRVTAFQIGGKRPPAFKFPCRRIELVTDLVRRVEVG